MIRSPKEKSSHPLHEIEVARAGNSSGAFLHRTNEPQITAKKPLSEEKIAKAVYDHIKAIRVLGRTRVNTAEIAKSLGLRTSLVDNAIKTLSDKGVRIMK